MAGVGTTVTLRGIDTVRILARLYGAACLLANHFQPRACFSAAEAKAKLLGLRARSSTENMPECKQNRAEEDRAEPARSS